MAITHIGRTTIYVDDQDRAKAFYTDVLGFELVMDMPMGDPGAARWIDRMIVAASRVARATICR